MLIGYRWLEAQKNEPLFPFGFGLSYSHFSYSKPRVEKMPPGGATVSVQVRNDGPVAGDDVLQVYLESPSQAPAGVQFPPSVLAAFTRVSLQPGESRDVQLLVPSRLFEYWSTSTNAWVRPDTDRVLRVGENANEHRLTVTIAR